MTICVPPRRLLTSLIFAATSLLLEPAFAVASQESCRRAESVIDELDRRNPVTTALILREAAAVKNSGAMLWRIDREGVASSYLFGTVHTPDETLQSLSPRTLTALRGARAVALETAEISSKSYPYVMAQAGPLMSARDKPLQRHLDEDELRVVERSVSAAGYPAELALGIRPWVATMFLTGSTCQPRLRLQPLDLIVAEEARRMSIEPVGLETMLEQFEALAAIDDEVQVAWLKASIATHDRLDDIAHTMAELYRFRRLDAVWRMTRELAPSVTLTDAQLAQIRDGLVGKRNPRLLARGLPLIEAGGAFIAVGALHLSGEDGLVEQLRRNGYIVTAIE